jgi:hypothetical protein
VGTVAYFQDTEGNVAGLMQLEMPSPESDDGRRASSQRFPWRRAELSHRSRRCHALRNRRRRLASPPIPRHP